MLAAVVILSITAAFQTVPVHATVRHQHYAKCPTAVTTIGQGPDTVIGRSLLDCISRCSESEDCRSVTVCPGGGEGKVICSLRNETTSGQCAQDSSSTSCHLVYKKEESAGLTCENGGTPDGTRCHCPLPFAGRYCQRYMRDCTEGYEQGHVSQTYEQVVHPIQPMSSPAPFLVKCYFNHGGLTYPLWRFVSGTSWSSATWTQVKDGLGDDLNVVPGSNNYFIGLDKLYQLLSQARYTNSIRCRYGSSWEGTAVARYYNFTVGPETSGYQLSYNAFQSDSIDLAEDGLPLSGSPFAASGNDGNGCAGSRGAPGWYGSACSGHSMFADPPTWPVPVDGTVDLRQLFFSLTRENPFIDDD